MVRMKNTLMILFSLSFGHYVRLVKTIGEWGKQDNITFEYEFKFETLSKIYLLFNRLISLLMPLLCSTKGHSKFGPNHFDYDNKQKGQFY